MASKKNPRKWAHEEVLQRYIKENPHKWRINGKKVLAIEYNDPFNWYPDLWFTVEGESNKIPVEVEWSSSDFNHPIHVLKDRNGWVFVCYKDKEDKEIRVPQYEIPRTGFIKWFKLNAEKLITETISSYEIPVKRKTPKLWIKYIGNRGGSLRHLKDSMEQQTSGIPKNSSAVKQFKNVQENDLIMFVIQGIGFPGRPTAKKWH